MKFINQRPVWRRAGPVRHGYDCKGKITKNSAGAQKLASQRARNVGAVETAHPCALSHTNHDLGVGL